MVFAICTQRKEKTMKIVDAHAHIFPEKIADKAVQSISDFYTTPMQHRGLSEALIESGNKIGVERYLVFSTATRLEQVESINNFIIDKINTYKEFFGLGTMFKGYKDFENELKKLKSAGIKGIKLHPDFQKFDINDPELFPIYDTLSELNMFVMTHAGDFRYGYSHPEKIAEVAKKFPKLNIIAAHFGGWSQWDMARDCLKLDNVYFDTSSTMGFCGLENAKKAFEAFDNTHIFFATDFPMWDHKAELENIMKLGLSDDMLENVLYNNFMNFYNSF